MPNLEVNPQQQSQDNMRGARPQNEGTYDFRPSNLYYDHGNARQDFHPTSGLQTANGNILVQRGQVTHPPKKMGPSTYQDVRFMDNSTIPVALGVSPTQVAPTYGQCQWPLHANSITYELKSLEGEVVHEAPALAVTTKAMRGNMPT